MGKVSHGLRKAFFTYVTPLIRTGRRKVLDAADFPSLPEHLDPAHMPEGFHQLSLKSDWAFLRSVNWAVRKRMTLIGALVLLIGATQLTVPVLIQQLVEYVNAGSTDLMVGILLATGVCLASFLDALIGQHYIFHAVQTVQVVINGVNFRIFRQALVLTRGARQKYPTGDVVNYMGTDTRAIAEMPWVTVEVVYAVFMILGVSSMLFYYIGHAAWAALGVMVAMSPLTKVIGKKFTQLDDRILTWRDKRVSMISQILSAMRIVKYFHWQDKFRDEINVVREKEVTARQHLAIAASVSLLLYVATGTVVCVAGFAAYVLMGNQLDAATVFPCIALFGLLEHPFGNMTHYISNIASAKVSAKRVADFLAEETLPEDTRSASAENQPIGISLRGVTAQYADAETPALVDVDLSLAPGEKVAVVGPLGSGKSTLLSALLGEVPLVQGKVVFTGIGDEELPRTAYVPQEAFIQNGTLRNNILFGSSADGIEEAVEAACLEHDLAQLPAGLETEIGEHGVNLSGGQKQRVSLARAIMQRPGLALLDDPLSAVDARTETWLIDHCIFGALQKSTVLTVTHRLQHLERFDRILFVEDGKISAVGTYKELLGSSHRFAQFMREHALSETHLQVRKTETSAVNADLSQHRITDDEDRESGAVAKDVYLDYLKAMGGRTPVRRTLVLATMLTATLVVTTLPILQNAWLSIWTNQLTGKTSEGKNQFAVAEFMRDWIGDDLENVAIFGVLGGLVLVFYFLQFLLWQLRSVAAGRYLHDAALQAVMAARLRFFDATPVGRILNRFSRDVDATERELPWNFEQTIRSMFYVIGSIVVMATVMPLILVMVTPVLIIYFKLQADYRSSAREAQRLNSVTRSPRFAHFKETLQGLSVIRGFRRQNLFWDRYYETLRENQRMFYRLVLVNRWFSVRIPLVSSLVSFGMAVSLIWLARNDAILAGTAGLVLLYSLHFWGYLNWAVRSFSEAESRMTSVERLRYYATIPAEPDMVGEPSFRNGEPWPTVGSIEFRNVWARYADHLPDVLRGMNLMIPGGAKVGFIGRTGAGKSTIFQTLFRFIELHKGEILIDGKRISGVPLGRLRRSIAIIPQDPTLFNGSLRDNLDRFGEHDDAAIWRSLRRAHLEPFIKSLPGGLNAEVSENGHNFSQGQRQLICLARALLVNAPIIVMDEATASVDVETDRLIQTTIREECAEQTVLIIAHRLGTVADCDLVVEMAEGQVASVMTREQIRSDLDLDGEDREEAAPAFETIH